MHVRKQDLLGTGLLQPVLDDAGFLLVDTLNRTDPQNPPQTSQILGIVHPDSNTGRTLQHRLVLPTSKDPHQKGHHLLIVPIESPEVEDTQVYELQGVAVDNLADVFLLYFRG